LSYAKDQLVDHPTWGIGRVLKVDGPRVTVFFKDATENPKTISVEKYPLRLADRQSDPWLDNLDLKLASSGKPACYLSHKAAVEKFLGKFPTGFGGGPGSKYWEDERGYKWKAHVKWTQLLDRPTFKELLEEGRHADIVNRLSSIESPLNLMSKFEKAALRDGLKSPKGAETFARAVFEFIYGKGSDETRFHGLVGALEDLPQPKSSTAKWPIVTIYPFIARPERYLFLKPGVTKEAAERRGFALNYKTQPNWLTYSCLLRFGTLLMNDLRELGPRDMIDIQSFIWATGR